MDILLAPAAVHKPAGKMIRVTFRETELPGVVRPAGEGLAGEEENYQQLCGAERLGPSADGSFRLPDRSGAAAPMRADHRRERATVPLLAHVPNVQEIGVAGGGNSTSRFPSRTIQRGTNFLL